MSVEIELFLSGPQKTKVKKGLPIQVKPQAMKNKHNAIVVVPPAQHKKLLRNWKKNMACRLNDYDYVYDVEKGGALFDTLKSSARNYGNQLLDKGKNLANKQGQKLLAQGKQFLNDKINEYEGRASDYIDAKTKGGNLKSMLRKTSNNLVNQGKQLAQREGQKLLNQGKQLAQREGQRLLNQGSEYLRDRLDEVDNRVSNYIDEKTGGNLKSYLRKTSNNLISEGKKIGQREGQKLRNQGKQLAQREGQRLLNQGSSYLQDKLDEVDNRVSNFIDEKTGGKLTGIAKVLNKAGKRVGNQLLNKAKQEGQRLLNEAKEQAIEQGKNALRTTVNGAFDGIGAFANNYVPGADIAVGYLQDQANRELDKKLGTGFGKGSQAMKDKMARIRAMRGKKKGGSFKAPNGSRGGSFREPTGGAINPYDHLTNADRGLLGVSSPYVQIQNSAHFRKQRGSGFLP